VSGRPRRAPLIRGRVSADGSTGFAAEPERYRLYARWSSPWSHRATVEHGLNRLHDVVAVSYVDEQGVAGPDGTTAVPSLREIYGPDVAGLRVPVLWDRVSGAIVSNDHAAIAVDLATEFGAAAGTYPVRLRPRIERLDEWLGPSVNHGVAAAGHDLAAWAELLDAFEGVDELLRGQRYLTGDDLTEADVRLWVTLVRFDAQANASRRLLTDGLATFPNLWSYARELYRLPAFATTTDFASFTEPGAVLLDWDSGPGLREF
jgi:glutathionyl-hydroquinone reductase